MQQGRVGWRAVLAALAFAGAGSAGAQGYPAKAVLMVIPLQAGSGVDAMMRIVVQKMAENQIGRAHV